MTDGKQKAECLTMLVEGSRRKLAAQSAGDSCGNRRPPAMDAGVAGGTRASLTPPG